MSREDVSVVGAAYETLAERGLEAFSEYWAEDIEWRAMRGHWRGKQEGLAYMREWLDLFDDFTTEVIELSDAGNGQVVTCLRYGGRAKRSGIAVPPEYFAILLEVRDGKMVRASEYATREEAMKAAA